MNWLPAGRGIWVLLAALWLVAVGTGFGALSLYTSTPGKPGARGSQWPADSAIPFDPNRPNVVVFVHPRCPCSRATLAELERALATTGQRAAVHVVLFRPEQASPSWERTDIRIRAAAIPGVLVWTDTGGIEANHFGAETSGLVVVYGASGDLLFQGGVTAYRGHEGDNTGSAELMRLINGGTVGHRSTPVFGCPIFEGDPSTDFDSND